MGRLDQVVRVAYRTALQDAIIDGRAKPLLIPYSILGASIVPVLWLTIPHTSRPWVYQTRWLVMAFVIWFNFHVLRTVSSTNFACAYGAGLMASWGTILTMNLLIWKRPQFEAARVIRVKSGKTKTVRNAENGQAKSCGGQETDKGVNGNGMNGDALENSLRKRNKGSDMVSRDKQGEGHTEKEERQHVWEMFPENGPFLERLGWVLDLFCSFRGAGWNYSITSIPRPPIPSPIRLSLPVAIAVIPSRTASGYAIPSSERELITNRLAHIVPCYLMLDLLSVQMMKDPYFIIGPDNTYPLPPHLAKLPPPLLLLYREGMSLLAMWAAIDAMFNANDLAQYYFFKRYFPCGAELWRYPSTFGSLSEILDRGLAGWWGSWWHQTFRMQFLSPSAYLLEKGYIERGTWAADAAGLLSSFFQSGLIHAAGSMTSIPPTKPWRSMIFFLLQGVGIALQQQVALYLHKRIGPLPKGVRQAGNVAFCLSWLYVTAPIFINDMASTGLWMFEPVPVSLFRSLRFGHVEDHWWRWDRQHWPKWYPAKHWWEIGIAL